MITFELLKKGLTELNNSILKSQSHIILNQYLYAVLLSNFSKDLSFDFRHECCIYKGIRIRCDTELADNEVIIKKFGETDYKKMTIRDAINK